MAANRLHKPTWLVARQPRNLRYRTMRKNCFVICWITTSKHFSQRGILFWGSSFQDILLMKYPKILSRMRYAP
nr:MAG TPA: hypothetical protein [Caudoviricetes sp.]